MRWEPMNGTLLFYECRLSGGETKKTIPVPLSLLIFGLALPDLKYFSSDNQ